jgi:ABC-type Zn uptake system ZnuABC Zn-binding protein ZnuA
MSLFLRTLAVLCLFSLSPSSAPAGTAPPTLEVVTTLPDLADIVREIGGERVSVQSLYKGKENTHAVTAKPSHLVALSRADLFVQVGLSLEASFVPGLLESARNERIRPGAPGFVNVSEGWQALDVPAALSRKAGDVHPQGNPHMNLDPRAGELMAGRILAGLVAVDPAGAEGYRARHAAYLLRLREAKARWDALGARWKGRRVVVYHQEYDYLIAAYGLVLEGKIEPKPGIPPTPNHVAGLIEAMRRDGCGAILTALWSDGDTVERIAEATGAKVAVLPNMCGGVAGSESWIGMMDLVHQRLEAVLAGSGG